MILVFIFGFLCGSSSEQRNIVQLCTKRTGSTKTDILFLTPLTGNDNDINNDDESTRYDDADYGGGDDDDDDGCTALGSTTLSWVM